MADPAAPDAQEPEQELCNLVKKLPDHYRQAILSFHSEEKLYEEVAVLLDLPLGTVGGSDERNAFVEMAYAAAVD